jgi:hypothetical protein
MLLRFHMPRSLSSEFKCLFLASSTTIDCWTTTEEISRKKTVAETSKKMCNGVVRERREEKSCCVKFSQWIFCSNHEVATTTTAMNMLYQRENQHQLLLECLTYTQQVCVCMLLRCFANEQLICPVVGTHKITVYWFYFS